MSLFPQVALATGVNKGIGFTIVQDLCCQSPRDIVLTAQDEARGWAAVKQLQARGPNPRFHLLDINDLKSIHTLRDFLCKEYGDLDMLVNTMGIAFKDKDTGTPRPGNFPYRTFHHGLGMVPECYRRACSSSRI